MEGAIAKTKREVIQLKNGYFKLELQGVATADDGAGSNTRTDWTIQRATYKFLLPPLNSMGFSDHYNQSLIKIKRAEWGNNTSTAFNEVLCKADGSGTFKDNRVNLHTNIPTRNQINIHNNGHLFDGSEKKLSNLQTPLYWKDETNSIFSAAALDGIATNDVDGTTAITEIGNTNPLAVDAGQTNGAGGGTEAAEALAAGAAGDNKFMVKRSKHSWCVDNSKTSIFDDGVLCGNPFGKEISFQLRDGFDNNIVGLTCVNGNAAENNTAHLRVELEVQLLPNP